MSTQSKPSYTPAPSQWQRHHAIQTEASCTTPSNRRRLLSGRDDVLVEQLKNIGPKAHIWLLIILNKCFMENKTVQDFRHTEAWERLYDSKELPTNIPLVSYVQPLQNNDTEQNSTNHRTTHNYGTDRFQTW